MSHLANFEIEADDKADNAEKAELEEFVKDIFSEDLTIDSKENTKEDLKSNIFSEDEVQYYDDVQSQDIFGSEKSETKKIESNQNDTKIKNFYLKNNTFRFRINGCKMTKERRKLLKQSLINVGIRNKEKMQEGLLFRSFKLNIDQTIALCKACNTNNGEFSFELSKFFLLEKMIESDSTFTLDEWKTCSATIELPETKIEANSLDWEERKNVYYSLFNTQFRFLHFLYDKEMMKNTLKKIEGEDYKDPVLSNFAFSNKRYDNARCVIAKKLAELGKEKEMKDFLIEQLDQFVSKKRLRTDEEEGKYTVLSSHKKIKIEAAVQKSEYKEENELPAKKAPEESKEEDLAADWELPELPPEPLAEEDLPDLPPEPVVDIDLPELPPEPLADEDLPDLPPEPTLEPESAEASQSEVKVRIKTVRKKAAKTRQATGLFSKLINEGGKYRRDTLREDYKRTIRERTKELKVKKLSWLEVFIWGIIILSMDWWLPYRKASQSELIISMFVGAALLSRVLLVSTNYFWTIATVLFIKWCDTTRFSFVPGEVYIVIALQVLLKDKKYAMIILLLGFVIYTIVLKKHWTIYLHYTVTVVTSMKEARVEHGAASILLAPYEDFLIGPFAIGVSFLQSFGLCLNY